MKDASATKLGKFTCCVPVCEVLVNDCASLQHGWCPVPVNAVQRDICNVTHTVCIP